jgi:hypothetical protein
MAEMLLPPRRDHLRGIAGEAELVAFKPQKSPLMVKSTGLNGGIDEI